MDQLLAGIAARVRRQTDTPGMAAQLARVPTDQLAAAHLSRRSNRPRDRDGNSPRHVGSAGSGGDAFAAGARAVAEAHPVPFVIDTRRCRAASSALWAAPTLNPDGPSPAGSLDRGKGEPTPPAGSSRDLRSAATGGGRGGAQRGDTDDRPQRSQVHYSRAPAQDR